MLTASAACIAWLFIPSILYTVRPSSVDEVGNWATGGSGLPANYQGVWFLSGNQEPTRCAPEARRNASLCGPGGWKRSSLFLFDTSRCETQRDPRTFVCNMALAGGYADENLVKQMIMFRTTYNIIKDDEYSRRPEHFFEGAAHMTILGVNACSWTTLMKKGEDSCPYRVTMYDEKGDGSRIKRLTWWGIDDAHTPQPLKSADAQWTYRMKRLVDGHGKVDKGVLAEMKRLYGSTVYRAQPRFW